MGMPKDFSGQDLRGKSFKDRTDLVGANFSHAQIQGANFTGADLTGANFTRAKAGLQRRQVIILLIAALGLSFVAGVLAAFSGYWIALFFIPTNLQDVGYFPGIAALITVAVFFIITIRQGFLASNSHYEKRCSRTREKFMMIEREMR